MLWVLIAVLALLAVLTAAGLTLLDYCCGRRNHADPWSEESIHKRGFDDLKESILSGKAWLEGKDREEVSITSADGLRLKGLFVPNPEARGTLLLFHGWRSTWKTDFIISMPFYYSLGLNLLAVDQRSQNGSEGKYITYGVRECEDLALWVQWAARRLGKDHPMFLGGLSMGASTVLMAADMPFDANVRGIVADCGFTSPYAIIRSVAARGSDRPLKLPMALLNVFTRTFAGFGLRERSTVDALKRTKLPVLLVHGLADDFVPAEMSRENYAACASEKGMVLVEGAGHGMSYVVEPERVKGEIEGFIRRHLPAEAPQSA